MSSTLSPRILLCLVSLFVFGSITHSQYWKEVNPPANPFNRQIHATVTGSSGIVYAAGDFTNANHEYIVEALIGNEWSELGAGTGALKANNSIYALSASAGKVFAAGAFANAAGYPYVAQYSNGKWSELRATTGTAEFNNTFFTLISDNNGNVYAAGSITDAGGFNYVAKWNGSSWAPLGTGNNALKANGYIYALAIDSAGNIYAGGIFTNTSGKQYVAKWNGTTWSEVGTGANALSANSYISGIEINGAGEIFAGGDFKNSNGNLRVAKWNGSTWTDLGTGSNTLTAEGTVRTMTLDRQGNVYVAGHLSDGPVSSAVYKWNGTTWSKAFDVPSLLSICAVNAMDIDRSGNIFTGGTCVNMSSRFYVSKWNGSEVSEPGRNGKSLFVSRSVEKIAVGNNGNVYAIGNYQNDFYVDHIAHWDGQSWTELGGDTARLRVDHNRLSMTADQRGNLYVSSTAKNAANHYYIAKWNGHQWSELNIKVYEPARVMTIDRHGNLYAAGAFGDSSGFSYGVMKWDGVNASYHVGYIDPVSLCVDSIGNIYCGNLIRAGIEGYSVSKFDGQNWTTLGTGVAPLGSATPITSIAIDKNGYILAGSLNNQGLSSHSKFVAKWDGHSWSATDSDPNSPYNEGAVYSMTSDPFGNVYASVYCRKSPRYEHIARWDGSAWSEVGDNRFFLNGEIRGNSIVTDTFGNVYAGGWFGMFGQVVGVYEVNAVADGPEVPIIDGVKTNYCISDSVQAALITNLPDTAVTMVRVLLDNASVNVDENKKISFVPNALGAGEHSLSVTYSKNGKSESTIVLFMIDGGVDPGVQLSASATQVNTAAAQITITAVAEGGGATPMYTFSNTGFIDNETPPGSVLQAESASATLQLKGEDLQPGANWIYVRMRSSEVCVTSAMAVDSIRIDRNGSNAVVDPDFPEVAIGSYPNPSSSSVTVSGLNESKQYNVRLVGPSGSPAMERTFANVTSATLYIQSLPGNVYWLQLYDLTKNRRIGTLMILKK